MYTIASAGFMRMENVGLPSVWPLQALDALCRLMSTALESLCFQLPSKAHVRLMFKNDVVEVAHLLKLHTSPCGGFLFKWMQLSQAKTNKRHA